MFINSGWIVFKGRVMPGATP